MRMHLFQPGRKAQLRRRGSLSYFGCLPSSKLSCRLCHILWDSVGPSLLPIFYYPGYFHCSLCLCKYGGEVTNSGRLDPFFSALRPRPFRVHCLVERPTAGHFVHPPALGPDLANVPARIDHTKCECHLAKCFGLCDNLQD